jgi:hypothetical protein
MDATHLYLGVFALVGVIILELASTRFGDIFAADPNSSARLPDHR